MKYKQRGSTLHLYDGIVMTALAMVATNSTDPKIYNPKVIEIANGVSGAAVVNTYKDGVNALKSGQVHPIRRRRWREQFQPVQQLAVGLHPRRLRPGWQ